MDVVETVDGEILDVVDAPGIVYPDGKILLDDGTYLHGDSD